MKIFCIGFHKTGTKSLAEALKILGYRVTGPNSTQDPLIAEKIHALADQLVPQYDAFQDNPWPILYAYLDKKYPESKFILTVRDPAKWFKSALRYFGENDTPMRRLIYGEEAGSPVGNEVTYIARFNRHNNDVQLYFQGRSCDLLVLDLEKEDGWLKLCRFLGKEIPETAFPHRNKGV